MTILGLLLLFFATGVSCSKKVYVETKWQSSAITVDGNPEEWTIPLRFFDTETKLNYEISNNNEGIFFAFRLNDMNAIHQFNLNGITIELDTVSTKKLACLLQYPVMSRKHNHQPFKGEQPDINSENNDSPDNRFPSEAMLSTNILLKGFPHYKKKVILSTDEVSNIKAAHTFDTESNQLFCEIFIPFKSINPEYTHLLLTNSDFHITLSMGTSENLRQGPPPGGGRPGDGGMQGPPGQEGGMAGSNRPGGRPDGPPPMNNQSQFKNSTISLQLQLATSPAN